MSNNAFGFCGRILVDLAYLQVMILEVVGRYLQTKPKNYEKSPEIGKEAVSFPTPFNCRTV